MRKMMVVAAFAVLGVVASAGIMTTLQARSDLSAVNVDDNRIAVGGYDIVTYRDDTIEPGTSLYRSDHDGAVYRFATADNKALFEADPAGFLPEFGGYCAYGVRMGQKLAVDPTAYEIVGGKLYFFLDRATMLTWKEDRDANIQIAHNLWPDLADTQ